MTTCQIPSASDPTKSYTVTLGPRTDVCTCPDHLYRERTCKHIRQARAEQFERFALLAGTVTDEELPRLIAKYQQAPSKGPVLMALLAEQWDRWELQRQPQPVPSYLGVIERARAWGREQRNARMLAIFA